MGNMSQREELQLPNPTRPAKTSRVDPQVTFSLKPSLRVTKCDSSTGEKKTQDLHYAGSTQSGETRGLYKSMANEQSSAVARESFRYSLGLGEVNSDRFL